MIRRLRSWLSGNGTLRRQAVSRLALVMFLAILGIAIVALNTFRLMRERESLQKLAGVEEYYVSQMPKLEMAWQTAAEQTKARIEFSRVLEEPEAVRWAKLNAYLTAQWEFVGFANLVVLDGQGKPLFRYGPEAQALVDPAALVENWFAADSQGDLYRVFRLPLWLGQQGQGSLLLLKTINPATLKAMEIPAVHLQLDFGGKTQVISSQVPKGAARFGDKWLAGLHRLFYVETAVVWPGGKPAPRLVVQREIQASYPLDRFLISPMVAICFVALLLWLGLGRWLNATVRRVESLGAAVKSYAQTGLQPALVDLRPAQSKPDEIRDVAGAFDSLMHDVDTREREQRAYLDTLALLEEGVLEMDCDGRILRASPGWNKLARCSDAVGRMLYEYIHPDDQEALRAQCLALQSGEKNHVVLRLRLHLDGAGAGHDPWLESRFVCYRDETDKVVGIRGVVRDITQTYLHEKQITHMALHDALTGLPNRILLEDRFKVALRLASRTGHKVGVCFIDLDHFKNINDSLGHKVGDKLLVSFSEALREQLRTGDTLARWGGDEFVMLLPDMPSEAAIREVAVKVSAVRQVPLRVEESEMTVTFSMGAAIYPDDGEDVETLFSQADRAMFYAKAQGRNQACFFRDMASKGIGKKELYIQNRLANAVSSQRIQAWFQPIVAADSGACVGVEVLARWHDDELGWVSPSTFIPMAENIGMIRELGQQVWLSSVAAARDWRLAGHELMLAVNVSKRQLFTPYFTEQLLDELLRHRLSPDSVMLEVTESLALLDVEHAAERLQELKQAGFRLAIDDFGTGYSSLSQLHEMQVDELKIDISFVRRLDDPRGLSMVQAIINLARALNLKTVAEGVETPAAADKLRELGVDCLQGFYFAQPMPRLEFEGWLERQTGLRI